MKAFVTSLWHTRRSSVANADAPPQHQYRVRCSSFLARHRSDRLFKNGFTRLTWSRVLFCPKHNQYWAMTNFQISQIQRGEDMCSVPKLNHYEACCASVPVKSSLHRYGQGLLAVFAAFTWPDERWMHCEVFNVLSRAWNFYSTSRCASFWKFGARFGCGGLALSRNTRSTGT